jgi:hypothetical protein
MRIARLGVAGAAAGVIALGIAGPAFATGTTPPPSGDISKQDTPIGRPGSGPVADVSPKSFFAGDTLTFTLKNCGPQPTITDVNNLFVKTNPFKSTSKGSWAAKETTHKNLIEGKEYKVIVKCGDSTFPFTTKPHKRPKPTPKPTSPSTTPTGVPSGAPQTGDGSSNGGGDTGLMVAGAAVVLAGLAGGTFLYTRRRSSAGA